MTVSEKLTTIARNVDRVFTSGKDAGEGEGYSRGLSVGYENGEIYGYNKARHEFSMKYFSQIITGDGTGTLSFHLPFEPDTIAVSCHDPDIRLTNGTLAILHLEPAALGQIGGGLFYTTGTGYAQNLMAVTSFANRFILDENGNANLTNFFNSAGLELVFGDGVDYIVNVTKTIIKSDKERFTDAVNRLPDGKTGTVQIWGKKKNAAFTELEWKNLIATKPTYTFNVF